MTDGSGAQQRAYRALQVASVALIVGGVVAALAVATTNPALLRGDGSLVDDAQQAVTILGWLIVAGFAVLVGLLANAARAVVVREALPASRYRGPSVIVMLVLAVLAANVALAPLAEDVVALIGTGELAPISMLVILTVTQVALLAVAALYVLAPRGLAGVRLLPERGLWRSVAIGLALAVPAWIVAQIIGALVVFVLDRVGMRPEIGVAEQALERADPVVLLVALVLVAPVAEEIFFRGVAYNAWLREYGQRRALYGSALLFGLIHGSLFGFLPIVVLGVLLAMLYRSTGSLPATMALHAGFNGITAALALLVRYRVLDIPLN
ncbi:MAG TPA: type II CAAX endopeptidase family protein [Candidatus Limnocylindria bacterium]|nr:type II CAAX endopeptidase family protein [Candidatus Limnocylindria bacterium]